MLRFFFGCCGFAAASLPAGLAAERIVQRSFAVQPGCVLEVDTYRGSIEIEPSPTARLRVEAHIDPGTDDANEAGRRFRQLQLDLSEQNNDVKVTARNPSETGAHFTWDDKQKLDLAYRIEVPSPCDLRLVTDDGAIEVGDVGGTAKAQAKLGTIFFRRFAGDIRADADRGDIVVARCAGAVTLRSVHGDIRLGDIRGKADLRAMNGEIAIQRAAGGLEAYAVVGDITAGFPAGAAAPSRLATDAGNIYVKIDPDAACAIDASSVWGHVETTLPLRIVSGGNGKSRMAGSLNGGGPLLVLHANGGYIHLDPL